MQSAKQYPLLDMLANALTCYEPRLQWREITSYIGYTSRGMYSKLMKLLRSCIYDYVSLRPGLLASHMRSISILGLTSIVALADTSFLNKLHNNLDSFDPVYRLVGSVVAFADGTVLVTFRSPRRLTNEFLAMLEKVKGLEILGRYETVLVKSLDCIENPEAEVRRQLSIRCEPTARCFRFIDALITSAIDLNPLLTLRDVSTKVLSIARFGDEDLFGGRRLSFRYVLRHYRSLAETGVFGRVWIQPVRVHRTVAFRVAAGAVMEVYRFLAAYRATGYMLYSPEHGDAIVVSALLPEEVFYELVARFADDIELFNHTVYQASFPLPFEFIDPRTGDWTLDYNKEVLEYTRRLRIFS
ncbi:hypothetical protein [Hyperthermus butylicus]|uniref:Uncharacterized protein n=1 Tax=Hyperthermus butylicus (strain DSM 5456 / JCM 9403 / PLM1-5) TaxID=415426 RepID=A2BMN5_HYPBU|nr:hypothetical protein [Hyperthermus butylicus]ABM81246.1 hypothetical protein Hbut_1422 [Hyperthermus butylicus DSM 5456]